jgi:hypothetical protein
VAGVDRAGGEAGHAEVPERVRRLERRVGDANAEGATVERTGRARDNGAEGMVYLPQAVKRNVQRGGRVG